jgi:hypothetical protein
MPLTVPRLVRGSRWPARLGRQRGADRADQGALREISRTSPARDTRFGVIERCLGRPGLCDNRTCESSSLARCWKESVKQGVGRFRAYGEGNLVVWGGMPAETTVR